jgi:peptidyl-prolyl cis-trans isomerase SurA
MDPWILALWLGSATATPPSDGWIAVERVVAVVDDDVVLASELDRRVAQARVALAKLADPERERRLATLPRETLQTIVEERLVALGAASLAITIDDTTIDGAVAQIREFNKLDDAGFARAVADAGWTMAEYRLDLQRQLLRFKLISTLHATRVTISDEAVQAAYAAEKAKNPALGELAGEFERLRGVLFERAMSEAFATWFAEARRTAHVELRL